MSRKQLASLGSAEAITGVPKDEIISKVSDGHVMIYTPDILQGVVPEWAFYFDNGLWRVGLADKPGVAKSQKTPNGFQYYHYLLGYPDDGFDAKWLCQYFGSADTDSLRDVDDIALISEELGVSLSPENFSQDFYNDLTERGIKAAIRNNALRRSELDPGDIFGREVLDADAEELMGYLKEGSYPGGRRSFDDSSDNAASNVSGAMKRARDRIEDLGYPEIASYLKKYVSGGKVLVYEPPEDEPHWILKAPEKIHEK